MKLNTKTLVSILVILLIIVIAIAFYSLQATKDDNTSSLPYYQSVTLTGTSECVPKKGPGPHTEECTIGGFKDTYGNHYYLENYEQFTDDGFSVPSGIITGILKPAEGAQWEKYDIVGIVEVTGVEQLEGSQSELPLEVDNAYSTPFQKSDKYGFYGTLTLTGYVDIQRRECIPGNLCEKTVDYVSFIFSDTTSEAIKEFTGEHAGNSYVAGDRVGIGCYEKDQKRIVYQNFADDNSAEFGGRGVVMFEGEINSKDLTELLNSSKAKPVRLTLTRPIYTSGQGAPDCYTHFRDFDVL
jgi:hypothetical protein